MDIDILLNRLEIIVKILSILIPIVIELIKQIKQNKNTKKKGGNKDGHIPPKRKNHRKKKR